MEKSSELFYKDPSIPVVVEGKEVGTARVEDRELVMTLPESLSSKLWGEPFRAKLVMEKIQ